MITILISRNISQVIFSRLAKVLSPGIASAQLVKVLSPGIASAQLVKAHLSCMALKEVRGSTLKTDSPKLRLPSF